MATQGIAGMSLIKGVKNLLKSGLYSDVTIKCGGTEFPVHKIILHTQSDFFAKLFEGGFKEATGGKKEVAIEEDPKVFEVLLHYMYNFTYDDRMSGDIALELFSVAVYQIADKYDVQPLRLLAAQRYKKCINPQKDAKNFVESLYAIESSTTENDLTLWDIAIPVIKANMVCLLNNPESGFKDAMRDMDELNFKLLSQLDISGMVYVPSPKGEEGVVSMGSDEEEREMDGANETYHYQHGHGRRLGDAC